MKEKKEAKLLGDSESRTAEAVKFLGSARGQYIVSQALYTAIETMKKIPKIHREYSNIEDMQYLLDNLFPVYAAIVKADNLFKKVSPNGKFEVNDE